MVMVDFYSLGMQKEIFPTSDSDFHIYLIGGFDKISKILKIHDGFHMSY